MKKIAILFLVVLFVFMSIFTTSAYALSLDFLTTSIDKDTIKPGEQVTIRVNFGTNLGAYTFNFAYDSNLLEYVSSEGGTAEDNGTRVRVVFYDANTPRGNMSITFKSKDTITQQSTAEIRITAEGLANATGTLRYDNITTPIVKSIIIQPDNEPSATTPTPVAEPEPDPTPTPSAISLPTSTPEPTKIVTPTPTSEIVLNTDKTDENQKKDEPKLLPKTGINIYIVSFSLIAILVVSYIYVSKKIK